MRMRNRATALVTAAFAMTATACGDEEPDNGPDAAAEQNGDADDQSDDPVGDGEAEPPAAASVGEVTLDGETVELEEAFWCEDYESGAGRTDMRVVGIANGAIKLDAGNYEDDGTTVDAVAIWQGEELSRGLGGTSLVAVEEGAEGYPWIEVDGTEVSIDGAFVGDDDPEGTDPVSFGADLEVEEEPRGSAHC